MRAVCSFYGLILLLARGIPTIVCRVGLIKDPLRDGVLYFFTGLRVPEDRSLSQSGIRVDGGFRRPIFRRW
jgi:hypothetical protein